MSEAAVAARGRARGDWGGAVATLAIGTAALLLLFHAEATAAVGVWLESTAFGHCFLVAPIAAWLAWERRGTLAGLSPRAWPAAALLVLPLGVVWLAAERLGIMEGRQFAVLGIVWTLALAVLGLRVAWAMAVPLAYLVFLVPFGAFLVPALQGFTARFIDVGLSVLDIPHVVTETIIEIPEGVFRVAEACAGLRFLIAAIAFGALYACMIYRSPLRRMAFIAVSIVVPVLANGVRALGIVLLGHIKGSAEAGAVDHVLYGWLFFSLVIVLLLLVGLPFRQDSAPLAERVGPPSPAAVKPGRLVAAAVLVVVLAAVWPAGAAWVQARSAAGNMAAVTQAGSLAARIVPGPGCVALDAAASDTRRFACGDVTLDARLLVFGPSAGPETLAALRDAIAAPEEAERSTLTAGATRWQIARMRDPNRILAAALWMDGESAPGGLALRLALALHSLRSAPGKRPVLMTVVAAAPSSSWRTVADVLDGFLRSQDPPDRS